MSAKLFEPLRLRSLELKNRIVMSPMCQYSALEGVPTAWHLVHLGSRAVGGAGMVMAEATAVEEVGRISPGDCGIWNEKQLEAWKPICEFIKSQQSVAAIQLAHAGRKASTKVPWTPGPVFLESSRGGWQCVAPSPLAFDQNYGVPRELSADNIQQLVESFALAARRSIQAGFEIIEVHAAHGYLLHEFLSPISNQRHDRYGGSFDNRIRFLCEVCEAVNSELSSSNPLFVRISASDWVDDGGWDIEQSVALARVLKTKGVDLIDVSSGGLVPYAKVPVTPLYQVPFAARIKNEASLAVGAVGLITEPRQAENILQAEQADLIFIAREFLRDPYWPKRAATELKVQDAFINQSPPQYARAW